MRTNRRICGATRPESALLLGRAVSLPDFEALAREFGGVVNARATWAWDGTMQRAVVAIRFISDGGSIATDLRRFLLGQSDPNTPLAVSEAVALESSLTVDLIVDSRFQSDDVEQAVATALTEPEKGLLALENIPIGLPLFRSAILEQFHAVAGVISVRALRFNGSEAPFGIAAGEGEYHDFLNGPRRRQHRRRATLCSTRHLSYGRRYLSYITNPALDEFERYYAEKLWEWIPPIYRQEDGLAEEPHVLRALVEILACQAAVARRSADRLWEDAFIHTCDDWAVPYIGALLGTRLVGNLNRRGRRVDVARTLFYRRRKGTPVVMEALIQDITGWEGAVVESFKRLARTRHRLDPEPGPFAGPITHTPPGGTADFRAGRISDIVDGPFDDLAHTPDFRRLRGFQGRYNIPKLNFHLYRLRVFEVNLATPFDFGDERFSIDPSGRDIPLFRPSRRGPEVDWTPVEEWQLPAAISCRLFNAETTHLTPDALAVTVGTSPQDPPLDETELHAGNLSEWTIPPGLFFVAIVDPHTGRLMLVNPLAGDDQLYVPRYHYGFSADLGAGTYDRSASVRTESVTLFPDGGNDPGPVTGFALPADGTHGFVNSKTYRPDTPPGKPARGHRRSLDSGRRSGAALHYVGSRKQRARVDFRSRAEGERRRCALPHARRVVDRREPRRHSR